MAFSSNPLSLSVPEAAFESWLRDSGYIELLDQRTSDLHRLSSSSSAAAATTSASTSAAAAATTTVTGAFVSLFSHLVTFLSLLSFNPFAKLSSDDFSAQTPPWTAAFFASSDAYSFPSSASQARLRVQENVKRYARNYASLFILFFACTLHDSARCISETGSCKATAWREMKVVVQVIKTEFMLGYTVQGMFTRDMIDSFASGAGTPGEEDGSKFCR
ncbi:hypothetical protein L484_009613 [Morus notabilis]|uniref:PRA1 family protein n=1 Tax=Morus notabilis TaxID=981085 RepID=W9SHZ8_9ROSA|nr:hypothetical protein L484_009613 [Morus notabilis]